MKPKEINKGDRGEYNEIIIVNEYSVHLCSPFEQKLAAEIPHNRVCICRRCIGM